MQSTEKIPRKNKPNPPAEINAPTPPHAEDSSPQSESPSATSENSEATEFDYSATGGPYSNETLQKFEKLPEQQKMAILKQHKEAWKHADKNKTKPVLLEELNLLKANEFVAQVNCARAIRLHKKYVRLAQGFQKDIKRITTKTNEEIEALQDELEKSAEDRAHLEKKLAKAIKNKEALRAKGRKVLNNEQEKVLLDIIEAKTKTVLWGLVKFIQSPEEELQAARYLIKFGDIPTHYCPTKEDKLELAHSFSDKIKRCIFAKRNYTTAEEKKYYVKMWKAGKPTLTVQDLQKCLERKIESDDDMAKFMLYWEEYLPKQVGAQEWDKNTRYYVTISQAKRQDCSEAINKKLYLVTPEDEAFLVLSIENGLQRWKEEFGKVQEGKKSDDKDYNGIFTSTTSGQNQYGGWSEAGLEKFKTYVAMNIEARKDPMTEQLEANCLNKLRVKWGIQSDNAVEHNKLMARMKSARKRGRGEEPMPPMKKVVRTLRVLEDISDDDE